MIHYWLRFAADVGKALAVMFAVGLCILGILTLVGIHGH